MALEVKQQQESGLNATAWYRLNGINPSSFFHRLKRVREASLENVQIASNASADAIAAVLNVVKNL